MADLLRSFLKAQKWVVFNLIDIFGIQDDHGIRGPNHLENSKALLRNGSQA